MFYPTGKTTGGKVIICKCCNHDEIEKLQISGENPLESLKSWLDENDYCMETWQVKEFLGESGIESDSVNEMINEYDEEVRFRFLNKSAEDTFEASNLYGLVDLDEEGDFVTDKKTMMMIDSYLNEEGYNSDDFEILVGEDSASAAAPGAPAAGFSTVATVPGMGNVASPTMDGTNASFYDPGNVGSGDRFDARAIKNNKSSKKKSKPYPSIKNFNDFLATMKKLQ